MGILKLIAVTGFMSIKMKKLPCVFLFLFFFCDICAFPNDIIRENKRYLFYPKAYKPWRSTFCSGISITRLPTEIVEEEVNTSPVIVADYRLGMPWKLSMGLKFSSNYISNLGSFTLYRSFINQRFSYALGGSFSIWFGHLDFPEIKLKSLGTIYTPMFSAGYDFRKFLLTLTAEMNCSFMKTFADDKLLGQFNEPWSLYSLKLSVEQPLWNNHSVILSVKNNYARFYYQSWLSYTTIKEFLYYPEFSFGFIF
jgi:hypothetical protein